MPTDTAIPVPPAVPIEPSFLLGIAAGLVAGAVGMYPVWHWLLKL